MVSTLATAEDEEADLSLSYYTHLPLDRATVGTAGSVAELVVDHVLDVEGDRLGGGAGHADLGVDGGVGGLRLRSVLCGCFLARRSTMGVSDSTEKGG